jgi:hypothetical protein
MGGVQDGAVSPEWADAVAAIPKEQRLFQEGVEPVVCFLLGAFAGERSFFSLTGSRT